MSHLVEQLKPYLDKVMAINTALVLFEWDNETLAPKAAGEYTDKVIGILSGEYFQVMNEPEFGALIEQCLNADNLSAVNQAVVKELDQEMKKIRVIPRDEYQAFSVLTAKAGRVWAKAREENDFDSFAPVLKEIISYQKKFASYRAKEGKKLYDILLDDFEPGFTMELLDEFFAKIKQQIIPLVQAVKESRVTVNDEFLTGRFEKEAQEAAAKFLAEYVGFDFNKGVLAESAHPFTTNLHNKDVRITTHYSNRLDSSIFSVIHEAGHGIYEMGIGDDITQTVVGQGASMGLHESQSRFYENMIGRSRSFWEPIYERLTGIFPDALGKVLLADFIKAINKVEPGLIRTEADELTYSLHVLIRYEIEKDLLEGTLEVEDLPGVWADKYESYLGIRPEDERSGVLQDIHWSQGSFGYFPSYALGSAFSAQFLHQMKKDMDLEETLRNGGLEQIKAYLGEKIHRYGKMKNSRQILKEVTGEEFNPDYYIKYLKEKYENLYGLRGEL